MGGTWNSSTPVGPLGPPCKLPRPLSDFDPSQCSSTLENDPFGCNIYYGENPTCQDLQDAFVNTCIRRSCYDDIAFIRAIVDYVKDNYCLDVNSVHMSGSSNGGMLAYSSLNKLNDIVATFGIIAASPILGFPDDIPLDPPVSIIDFHGLEDTTFPYDLDSDGAMGTGPYNTVLTPWDFYVFQKPNVVQAYNGKMNCGSPTVYPTDMDNDQDWDGWKCHILPNCQEGNEFVTCTGNYDHGPPYDDYGGAPSRIIWDFMKRHARNGNKKK